MYPGLVYVALCWSPGSELSLWLRLRGLGICLGTGNFFHWYLGFELGLGLQIGAGLQNAASALDCGLGFRMGLGLRNGDPALNWGLDFR